MRIGLLGIVLAIGAIVALFNALNLIPPETLRMAAGNPGSAYHHIATRYAAILARDGITLEIVGSGGSVDNAALLGDDEDPVDVALLQGGIEPPEEAGIMALASVFLEPLFIFQRPSLGEVADLNAWDGLRVAIGGEGSGTRAAILRALRILDISLSPETLLPLGGQDATDALLAGEIDVAVFIAPVTAPYLAPLLGTDAVTLAELRDVSALERRIDFVELVDVPRGGFDYKAVFPTRPVALPALVARLAAQPDLHPALVDRLVRAARIIHGRQNVLTREGRFPNARNASLPLNPQAVSALDARPSALENYVPYWIMAQVNRVAVLLLPIIFLLLPLLRALPGLYGWSMHKRVYRHYDDVLKIDAEAADAPTVEALDALAERLDAIEDEARRTRVPPRYGEYLCTLGVHLGLVRNRIARRREALGGG
jgi:ABC-type nitrate/sulfonate/bicarbonate transport system substrate-binding protein